MLLVDALYVNMGGALSLLRYLVRSLQERDVEFFLLADARCGDEFKNLPHVASLVASLKNRRSFYLKHKNDFTSVFCFGNIPAPLKMPCPVYTYFHNVNMLTLQDCRDWKQYVKFWLKRSYIKSLRYNSDAWFVQTSNTANELCRNLTVTKDVVKLYPFYELPKFPQYNGERKDYIFVGEYSGSKGHDELLEAWKMLHQQGIDVNLHLTVTLGDAFLQRLDEAVKDGVKIINHGFVPFEELANLYVQCRATVYPSYNESFGLGLIEAMEAGCDVIASDRPFVHTICKPSEVFDPSSPESIAKAIERYETISSKQTKQLVHNQVWNMIDSMMTNNE